MLIDVKKLSLGEQLDFDFKENLVVRNVPVEAHVFGKVSFTEEGYIVSGNFDAVLNLKCDLCLDAFTQRAEGVLDEVYSNDADEEKEYWHFEDKTLDLQPALEANIMLKIPMKAVCSDNCRGLCPKCGQNLNKGECGCDREYSNPVFEGLMDLFKD